LLAEASAFVERGAASGALLDADGDRRAAQGLLDFWSNLLYRSGHAPGDATLADFDPELAPALDDTLCPYLGLDAFREDNAALFFGRQRLVAKLVAQLGERRLVAVVGPSGSGKSSLARAGLIPALKAGALPGSAAWQYLGSTVPSSDPLASLARLLVASAGGEPAQELGALKQNPEHLASRLGAGGAPALLVVDQFEEVFTLCDDEGARWAFIGNLLGAVSAPGAQSKVVLTMRSDFEAFVARVPELHTAFEQGRVQVMPLSAGELREAIEQPAARIGLKFEAGLVDQLQADILGEPAALPLLQFTLLKLWERRERNRISLDAYQKVGGGRLALARSADAFYDALIPEEQVTARRILLRMVRPGEGLEVTSSRVRRATLYRGGEDPSRVDRVLEKLIVARLVRLTEGDVPEDAQVEVAHEALVRNWPTLVAWLEEDRETLRRRQCLTSAAAQWEALGQNPGALLRGAPLDEVLRYHDLSDREAAFAQASQAAIKAEQERETERRVELAEAQARAEVEARANRQARRLLTVIVIMAIVAFGSAILAIY
jgi:hypothetical protein